MLSNSNSNYLIADYLISNSYHQTSTLCYAMLFLISNFLSLLSNIFTFLLHKFTHSFDNSFTPWFWYCYAFVILLWFFLLPWCPVALVSCCTLIWYYLILFDSIVNLILWYSNIKSNQIKSNQIKSNSILFNSIQFNLFLVLFLFNQA